MQEGFDFRRRLFGDGADFVEGEFAGERDALEAEARGGADAFEVVQRHLRGSVQAQRGEVLPREAGHAEILHDDRVRAGFGAEREGADQIRQLGFADQRVERDVDAARARQRVGIGDDFLELARGEVDGFGARGEARQPGIDGVGAERERGVGRSFLARGREKFGGGRRLAHGFSSASATRAAWTSAAIRADAAAASGKCTWPRRRRVKAISTRWS